MRLSEVVLLVIASPVPLSLTKAVFLASAVRSTSMHPSPRMHVQAAVEMDGMLECGGRMITISISAASLFVLHVCGRG